MLDSFDFKNVQDNAGGSTVPHRPAFVGNQPSRSLRPFFGYYGGKWRDAAALYPAPTSRTIVEPFAGSAGYSLRHADREIILCDIDPIIAGLWRYLISVTQQEIMSLPDVRDGQTVDDLNLCQEARWLIGFWLNRAATRPRKSPSKWMRDRIRPGSFWGDRVRRTISAQLDSIRHWKIYECSYTDCPGSRPATWFIDPPYIHAGRHYAFGSANIDYSSLASWCLSRPGEVIVCENAGAEWLPFKELASVKTTRANRRSKEVYWWRPVGQVNADNQRSATAASIDRLIS
jgi:site-specific DNA-adenine methylase